MQKPTGEKPGCTTTRDGGGPPPEPPTEPVHVCECGAVYTGSREDHTCLPGRAP